MLSALRTLVACEYESLAVSNFISMSLLELSRVLLPVELATEGVESVEEINRGTREMEQA